MNRLLLEQWIIPMHVLKCTVLWQLDEYPFLLYEKVVAYECLSSYNNKNTVCNKLVRFLKKVLFENM
jgi:hypothetical protein